MNASFAGLSIKKCVREKIIFLVFSGFRESLVSAISESLADPKTQTKTKMKSKNTETREFTKAGGRWFPVECDMIDSRGSGFKSQKEIRNWSRDYSDFTGKKITLKFR